MSFGYSNDLKHLLHPYVFVLKEGDQKNLLDYKLMMLKLRPEVIKSPSCTASPAKPFPEIDLLKAALAEALMQTQSTGS